MHRSVRHDSQLFASSAGERFRQSPSETRTSNRKK